MAEALEKSNIQVVDERKLVAEAVAACVAQGWVIESNNGARAILVRDRRKTIAIPALLLLIGAYIAAGENPLWYAGLAAAALIVLIAIPEMFQRSQWDENFGQSWMPHVRCELTVSGDAVMATALRGRLTPKLRTGSGT